MRLLLPTLISCAIAYFVCGIPFGMLIARSKGVDVRHTGSGNIGATNVGRSVGAWAAGLTLLLDAGKGWLCTGLASWAFSSFLAEAKAFAPGQPYDWALTCVYAACVLGHVFSPYLGFHGGKGISVGFGAALWTAVLGYTPMAVVPMVIVAACVVWAHRENIRKLAHHKEKRFSFHHDEGKSK